MKIYNVLIYDRHTDLDVHNFGDAILAIDYAKQYVLKYGSPDDEDFEVESESDLAAEIDDSELGSDPLKWKNHLKTIIPL